MNDSKNVLKTIDSEFNKLSEKSKKEIALECIESLIYVCKKAGADKFEYEYFAFEDLKQAINEFKICLLKKELNEEDKRHMSWLAERDIFSTVHDNAIVFLLCYSIESLIRCLGRDEVKGLEKQSIEMAFSLALLLGEKTGNNYKDIINDSYLKYLEINGYEQ